jgi:hypothetical protein
MHGLRHDSSRVIREIASCKTRVCLARQDRAVAGPREVRCRFQGYRFFSKNDLSSRFSARQKHPLANSHQSTGTRVSFPQICFSTMRFSGIQRHIGNFRFSTGKVPAESNVTARRLEGPSEVDSMYSWHHPRKSPHFPDQKLRQKGRRLRADCRYCRSVYWRSASHGG